MQERNEQGQTASTTSQPQEAGQPNILLEIAQRAQQLTGAETASVALSEDDGTNVYYAEGAGKLGDWIRGRRGAAATSGLCGVAFQGYNPVLVCEARGDPRVRQDHVSALGITTALGVPVYFEGKLLGALLLFNKQDGSQFDIHDEEVLAEYARECAPLLHNYLQTASDNR